jgi:hypothetical protein
MILFNSIILYLQHLRETNRRTWVYSCFSLVAHLFLDCSNSSEKFSNFRYLFTFSFLPFPPVELLLYFVPWACVLSLMLCPCLGIIIICNLGLFEPWDEFMFWLEINYTLELQLNDIPILSYPLPSKKKILSYQLSHIFAAAGLLHFVAFCWN